MAEAVFMSVFVTVFVVGTVSLIRGEFQGWGMVMAWFFGILAAKILVRRLWRRSRSSS